MLLIKKTFAFPLFFSLSALAFFACSDGSSPDDGCPFLPRLYTFHAKWVDADTVQIKYVTEPLEYHSEKKVNWVVCRLYRSESPEGPWEHIDTDSLNGVYDSSRCTYRVANPDRLNFFRLNMEYVCTSGTRQLEGPMIATRRPVSHPDQWQAGPDLVSPVVTQMGSRGGTVISQDGTKLFAGHREGRIFDLATGKDITPPGGTRDVQITHAARWVDSMLYCYGGSFRVYNLVSGSQRFGVTYPYSYPGSYSYPRNDTSFVVFSSENKILLDYNTIVHSTVVVEQSFQNPRGLANTVPSTSYSKIGCCLPSTVTPNTEQYIIFTSDFNIDRIVSPFGNTALYSERVIGSDHLEMPHMQWTKTDDRIFFWARWSGTQEIWTYSLSTGEYKQITGYRSAAYPGDYVAGNDFVPMILVTLNFVYDPTRDGIIMFFRRDVYSYAMRFVPVAGL